MIPFSSLRTSYNEPRTANEVLGLAFFVFKGQTFEYGILILKYTLSQFDDRIAGPRYNEESLSQLQGRVSWVGHWLKFDMQLEQYSRFESGTILKHQQAKLEREQD